MQTILDWRDAEAWMTGDNQAALLSPVRDDALRQWIISTRVNKAGVGDDDPALMEPANTSTRLPPAEKRPA
jgi:putative SOS response-associated peptidase YedK